MTKQAFAILALFCYVFIRSYFVEPNSLDVTRYELRNTQLAGVKVVFFSDLHLKKRDYARLNKIIKTVNKEEPDVVLIGGDFARGKKLNQGMDINVLASKLNLVTAPILAVLGNYDWNTDGDKITEGLKDNGITVLENSSKRILIKGKLIDIVGIADLQTRRPNIERALSKTKMPRIVITHNPDIYYNIIDDVSIILAGHTHGGQFILPFSPPLFVPSKFGSLFASGLISNTNNKMIITKGIGTSSVPFRLNCKPEIVVVEFVR